ncbi:MAG: zf-HC2 domain-containing protein [Mariniblastus sp.]
MNNKANLKPSCEEFEVLISAMIDGELLPTKLESLQAHLDICTNCREQATTFKTIDSLVAIGVESIGMGSIGMGSIGMQSPSDNETPTLANVKVTRPNLKVSARPNRWLSIRRLVPLAAAATLLICLAFTAIQNPKPVTAEQVSPEQFVQPVRDLHFINLQQQRDQELMLRTLKMDLRSLKLEINQLEPGSDERIKLVQQIDSMLEKVSLFAAADTNQPTE